MLESHEVEQRILTELEEAGEESIPRPIPDPTQDFYMLDRRAARGLWGFQTGNREIIAAEVGLRHRIPTNLYAVDEAKATE
jgi:hypothetical protein